MKKDILIFGTGGHAKVVIDLIEKAGVYRIAGLVAKGAGTREFFGYPVLGRDEDLPGLAPRLGIVAIGDNWIRRSAVAAISKLCPDFKFVSAVHPSAQIGRAVQIGEGSVIMAGVCINSDTQIGAHCIVNTGARVDHDNLMGDYASIAPGATTGGQVRLGELSALGLGASVIQGIEIGSHTVIGAGAVVVEPLPANVVAYGAPCRKIRERTSGQPYLR